MKTKSHTNITKAVIVTTMLVVTIIISKHLVGEVKHIYKTEEHQQALSCIIDILQ